MTGGTRWGVARFAGAWAVVMAAQFAAAVSLWSVDYRYAVAAVVVLQALKIPAMLPRLRDLGYPPDDALWAVVPLFNIGWWVRAFAATPSEELRQRRVRSWSTQLTAVEAFGSALHRMAAASGVQVLLATLGIGCLLAAVHVAGVDAFTARTLAPKSPVVNEALSVVVLMLGLYTLAQMARSSTVSRGSWWPSTLLLPAILLRAFESLRGQPLQGLEVLVSAMPDMALMMMLNATLLPLLVAVWVLSVARGEGGPPWGELPRAWWNVAPVYAGRDQIVELGAQVVVPGVWFSISYAFADLIALVRPERPAFAASSALTSGIRNKLFKMLAIWLLMTLVAQFAVASVFHSPAEVGSLALTPHLLSPWARAGGDLVSVLFTWWAVVAMLTVFEERDALLQARQAQA